MLLRYYSAAFLFSLVFFAGCTRIAVRNPVGESIPTEETIGLVGTWVDPDQKEWVVRFDEAENQYSVSHIDKGEIRNDRFSIRDIGDEVFIVWFEDRELAASVPLRILPPAGGELRTLTLLFADESEVETLVAGKVIQGQKHSKEDAWILEPDGLAPYLASKTFWRLDSSMPFVKRIGGDEN